MSKILIRGFGEIEHTPGEVGKKIDEQIKDWNLIENSRRRPGSGPSKGLKEREAAVLSAMGVKIEEKAGDPSAASRELTFMDSLNEVGEKLGAAGKEIEGEQVRQMTPKVEFVKKQAGEKATLPWSFPQGYRSSLTHILKEAGFGEAAVPPFEKFLTGDLSQADLCKALLKLC